MSIAPSIVCFQCANVIRALDENHYEAHQCRRTPYADPSLRFQRQMIADVCPDRHPETWLIEEAMRDHRDGRFYSRLEMFDRMAVLLAVCLDFGV